MSEWYEQQRSMSDPDTLKISLRLSAIDFIRGPALFRSNT
jgi:hypothetical protein